MNRTPFLVSVRCDQTGWYHLRAETEAQAKRRLSAELRRKDLTTTKGTIHNAAGDQVAYRVRQGWS